MIVDPEVTTARAVRNAARTRLGHSLAQAKVRLTPGALAGNAADGVKSMVGDFATDQLETARQHPARTAAIVAAIGVALLRKPLFGWFRSSDDADDDADDATDGDDAS